VKKSIYNREHAIIYMAKQVGGIGTDINKHVTNAWIAGYLEFIGFKGGEKKTKQ
jgi:hypothetical protein